MKYAELTRKLRRMGCEFTRYGAGSHEIWRNPTTGKQVPIPYHYSKDIGTNLLFTTQADSGMRRFACMLFHPRPIP
jgi:predicted RNA binding protein YcfA (HicA-like mRNA interferase family)